MSPPFWPFRKKQPEEESEPESNVIEYGLEDENSAGKILDDRSHLEDESYKLAMDKLGLNTNTDTTISPENNEVSTNDNSSEEEWFENEQDGYWYRKLGDGSWDPKAYVKSDSGEFEPYS